MYRRSILAALAAAVLLAVLRSAALPADPASPQRGYVIAEITVTDAEAYKQYAAAAAPVVARFGGRYLIRGGQTAAVEGDPPAGRIVVIEFQSLAAARAFEDSSDYQAIAELRHRAARSRVFLAEGTAQ